MQKRHGMIIQWGGALVGILLLAGCNLQEREMTAKDLADKNLPDEMSMAEESRNFTGWVIIRRDLMPEHQQLAHFSEADLNLHNEAWVRIADLHWNSKGTRVPVVLDGKDMGYEVELAQVVYGNRVPVLKLAVYKKGVKMALAYTWAAPDSRRIGINLRWMQAGLTRD